MPEPVEVLVTANAAYPRLEALFLAAKTEIRMGFRLFDPATRLHSDAGLAIGRIWQDLIVHTLNRGVAIELTLSDFDPVMAHDMHVQAWRFVGRYNALNEMTATGAAWINVRCVLHPAEGGIVPRLMFALRTRAALRKIVQGLNAGGDPELRLRFAPGLAGLVAIRNGRAACRPGALPRLFPVSLHHKMAVFDGAVTYIGGLDLNNRRFDDADHDRPAQETWHDVQLVLHDPAVARDAVGFLDDLIHVIAGEMPPARPASAFCTTQSRRRRQNTFALSPKTVARGLLDAHLDQIGQARQLIYLESQFFRDRHIAAALAAAGQRQPELRLLLLLPAAPEVVAFDDHPGLDGRFGEYLQARSIRRVRRAFGARFLAVSPVQPRPLRPSDAATERAKLDGAPIVYVHAKVSLFDAAAAIVSSANLNGRSMKWDAETGVVLTDPDQVSAVRDAVFRHWLTANADASFYAPDTAFDAWHRRAHANLGRKPEARVGFILPYALDPAVDLGQPIPGAPEAMV